MAQTTIREAVPILFWEQRPQQKGPLVFGCDDVHLDHLIARQRVSYEKTWFLACGLPASRVLGLMAKVHRPPKQARPFLIAAACNDVRQLRGRS
eukprot:9207287-Lingulodinium_polyedra.AAC.1